MDKEILALLIDDNPIDNFVNRKMIERASFAQRIIIVESAMDALRYLESAEPNDFPDYIFLDVSMPEMNGFEFLESYKYLSAELHKKCRIYMLSSSMHPDDLSMARENARVSAFLHKPLHSDTLQALCA